MKRIINAMKPFIQEIYNDFMLMACLLTPIFMGVIFKYALPLLERTLCLELNKIQIISPYYIVFDLLLTIMAPIMFSFAGVMTILVEIDNGTAKSLCVTPLGKSGYLESRIVIPTVIAFFYTVLCLSFFTLTNISFLINISICFCSCLLSIITSMIVITLSKNKLEGMAIIKLSGLLILGVPAVYFLPQKIQYFFYILPTFWSTKLAQTENYLYLIPTIIISLIWIGLLSNKFKRKFL